MAIKNEIPDKIFNELTGALKEALETGYSEVFINAIRKSSEESTKYILNEATLKVLHGIGEHLVEDAASQDEFCEYATYSDNISYRTFTADYVDPLAR